MDSTSNLPNEATDVDKSIFDAEQFLSNYTSLREECDGLKTENNELRMRVQQLSQELNQTQIDKQNLERNIQKEVLTSKETVWNLKLEIQKSQEERLSWKEKYLDLCIKSSQTKDLSVIKEAASNLHKDERKTNKRKPKRKTTQRREYNLEESSMSAEKNHTNMMNQNNIPDGISNKNNPDSITTSSSEQPTIEPIPQQVEPLSITTSLGEETTNMPTADMVTSLDTNHNTSSGLTQTHVVTTDATDYYSLQAAPFDLNNQGDTASGTTTFILQTPDATFCATAVLDDQTRTTFDDNPFSIKTSNGTFDNQSILRYQETLPDSGSESEENTQFNFRCNLCNFTYRDRIDLDKHMKSKHTEKKCVCKHCGKAYSTKSSLAQHVHHYHRHPLRYTCDVCEKKFNRKDFLIKHQKTHTDDRTFQCGHCDKQFKTSAGLSAHVNGAHNDARRFVCDYCGMRTSWRLSHLEHMKLHTGEPRKIYSKRKKQSAQEREAINQHLQHEQLQQSLSQPDLPSLQQQDMQSMETQELQQLVVDHVPNSVVQFITTADG